MRGVWFTTAPSRPPSLQTRLFGLWHRPARPPVKSAACVHPEPPLRHADTQTKTPAPRIQTSATSLRASQLLTSRPLQPLLGQQRPDGHRAGASWTALEGSANVSHAAVRNQLRSANLTAPLPPQARLFTVTVCPTYYRSRRSPTHHRLITESPMVRAYSYDFSETTEPEWLTRPTSVARREAVAAEAL